MNAVLKKKIKITRLCIKCVFKLVQNMLLKVLFCHCRFFGDTFNVQQRLTVWLVAWFGN
jgi:hypothetical protein